MRISDWSSDVCSSDLCRQLLHDGSGRTGRCRDSVPDAGVVARNTRCVDGGKLGPQIGPLLGGDRQGTHLSRQAERLGRGQRDRKSVVSGKSVSVRVDLGGRRIIKKTKKNQKAE